MKSLNRAFGSEGEPGLVKDEDAYHHGDLPATLMDLALEHIAADGVEKLSLRALAREAGVSATAPYRHFPSKRCLLAALATRGFRALRDAHSVVIIDPNDLSESFVQMGLTYIRFATDNPTTYQIMFGTVIDDFTEYPDLAEAADQSFEPVGRLIEKVLAHRPDWDMTYELLGGIIWTTVHGIASLLIFASFRADVDESLVRRPNRALNALLENQETALRTLVQGIVGGNAPAAQVP